MKISCFKERTIIFDLNITSLTHKLSMLPSLAMCDQSTSLKAFPPYVWSNICRFHNTRLRLACTLLDTQGESLAWYQRSVRKSYKGYIRFQLCTCTWTVTLIFQGGKLTDFRSNVCILQHGSNRLSQLNNCIRFYRRKRPV